MNREYVEEWLNKLKEYWVNKDIENVTNLFKNTTFYQETPFMNPFTTFEKISEEWQPVRDVDVQKIDFIILAVEGYTAIINWKLRQNDENYDGIYEIKFNDNLDCIYFKSWEMIEG